MTGTPQQQAVADDQARAIRALLVMPMLDGQRHPDDFVLVARHRAQLVRWFDETVGWPLHVDVRGRWARLHKRRDDPDPTRPARSVRGQRFAFDRRRYSLLCLICAELAVHRLTTIGLLARNVAVACAASGQLAIFRSDRHRERRAFVDALRLLARWGVVQIDQGDAEEFVASDRANAFVEVDSVRLHALLGAATAPSALAAAGAGIDRDPIVALTAEPRYRGVVDTADGGAVGDLDAPVTGDGDRGAGPVPAGGDEQRIRWLRHSVARRLFDDPVVYLADLAQAQREYIANPAGRRWLVERAGEAGLQVEERAEGLLAIDPTGEATDESFPAPNDNVRQAALLLAGELVSAGEDRSLRRLEPAGLERWAAELLAAHPGWARQYRDEDGAGELGVAAARVLERFGLATRDELEGVTGLPAVARYRPDLDAVPPTEAAPTLFAEPAGDQEFVDGGDL